MHLRHLNDSLRPSGLLCLGGFVPQADDSVPGPYGPVEGGWLELIGNAGPAMWRAFEGNRPIGPDPLDTWTRSVIDAVATGTGVAAFYPFSGPPYLPFQRWAWRTKAIFASPLGIAIHPDFGLWHAYRAALLFDTVPEDAPAGGAEHPCDSCQERPCLSACPVDAFDGGHYDVPACREHLDRAAGAPCRRRGCLARHACPVGRAYAYAPDQAAFHMASFRKLAAD